MDSVMRTLLVLSAWLCVQGRLEDVRKENMAHEGDFQQSGRIPTTTCLPLLNQTVPRLVERYSTSTVASEFIVKFSGFYEESARRGYIAAALAPLSESVSFEVVPRDNPMAEYPSDFDVVQLGANHKVGKNERYNEVSSLI